MSWIKEVEPDDWRGELAELLPEVTDPKSGRVDNILKVHSLDAGSMLAHLGLYIQAMKPTSSLSKAEREMIALVVSKTNSCHY